MRLQSSTRSAIREQRGSVLLATLMLVFILTVVGLAFFSVTTVESRLVAGKQKEMQLLYAAEAGITRAHLYWEKGLTSACGTVGAMPTFDAVYADTANPHTTFQLCAGEAFGNLAAGTTATYTVTATKWDPAVNASDATRPCTVPAGADSAVCVKVISTACVTPADPKAPCVSLEANLAKVQSVGTEIVETPVTFTAAKYPFYASHGIKLNTGEIVDSFDSSVGPYATSKCQAYACRPDPFVYINDSADEGGKFLVPSAAVIYGNVTVAKDTLEIKSSGGNIVGDVTYDTADAACVGCTPAHVTGPVTGTTPIDPVNLDPVTDCTNDMRMDPVLGPVYARPSGGQTADPTRNNTTGYSRASWVASQTTVNSGSPGTYNDSTGFWDTRTSSITLAPGVDAAGGMIPYCFGGPKFGDLSIPANPAGPVVVKVNQDTLLTGGLINTTLDASNLQLLSSVDSTNNGFNVGSNSDSFVYLYAPKAQILVSGHGDLYGAAIGRQIETSGSANLHFDKALGRPGKPLAGGVTTTSTVKKTITTTVTGYGRQRWVQCPASGCP